MWRKGKRKEEDVSDEGDFEGAAPSRKTSKKFSGDANEIVVCEISKNRRVMVRTWQEKVIVDIREFFTKDGKQLPGKKGISLSMDQWKILRDHIDEIDQALKEKM